MTKILTLLVSFFLFTLACGLPLMQDAKAQASGSKFYVDNSVATSGNGSISAPWKNPSNINWATISAASKPVTIYISGGTTSQTYNQALSVGASGSSSTWPYNGVSTGEIIIKRPSESEWPRHSGIVYIRNSAATGYAIDVSGQSNIIIDGIDFRNTRSAPSEHGMLAFDCDHIVVRNCTSNANQGAVVGAYRLNYFTAQYNNFGPNNVTNGDDVFMVNGHDWMIENNIIHASLGPLGENGPHGDGMHFGDGGDNFIIRNNLFRITDTGYCILVELDQNENSPTTNVKIYGNVFEKAADSGTNTFWGIAVWCDRAGDPSYNYATVYIYGNTFVNNDCCPGDDIGAAIQYGDCTKSSQRLWIKNNIFYNSKVWIEGITTGSTLQMDYNLYYNTGTIPNNRDEIINWKSITEYSSLSAFSSDRGFETHGIQADPQLQSVSGSVSPNHDLRPTASSPGNDAGTDLGSPYDFGLSMDTMKSSWPLSVSLISRPQGSGWDIGAYEYQSTPTQTCPQLSGTCCSSGQSCTGSFQPSSDCGSLCCAGGTCQNPPSCGDSNCDPGETCPADNCCSGTSYNPSTQVCCSGTVRTGNCCGESDCSSTQDCISYQCTATCTSSGYQCCPSCASGPQPQYDSSCSGQVCCAACSQTCHDSTASWSAIQFPAQAGTFSFEFDATPLNPSSDALTGLSPIPGTSYADYAVLVRFNDTGYIDARNGGAYGSDGAVPYVAGSSYHFRIPVNLSSRKYSVYVRPQGEQEQLLASNYDFRSEQASATQLNYWGHISEAGGQRVCDISIRTMQFHKSDTNQDGCVSQPELTAFITRWYISSTDVTIKELMEAIGFWKGSGC